MDLKALRNLSYGLYIVCSKKGDNWSGQIANTVMQITSDPATIAVSINKENLTSDYIKDSKVFTVSILNQEVPMETIGHFGFKTGKEIDKFKDLDFETGTTGAPLLKDNIIAWLEAEVLDSLEIGTHTIFVGKIINAEIIGEGEPLTYAYYHQVKKGKAPKTAPTYQPEEEKPEEKESKPDPQTGGDKYRCTVCGYIYDPLEGDPDNGVSPGTSFNDIPDDWVCPICGADKDAFEPEG